MAEGVEGEPPLQSEQAREKEKACAKIGVKKEKKVSLKEGSTK